LIIPEIGETYIYVRGVAGFWREEGEADLVAEAVVICGKCDSEASMNLF